MSDVGQPASWQPDLPATNYHKEVRVSASLIKSLHFTGSLFKSFEMMAASAAREPTDEMDQGSAIHAATLEPHQWQTNVKVVDQRRSKADKESAAEARRAGKIVLREKHVELAEGIKRAVWEDVRCDALARLLQSCNHKETSIFFDIDGLPCKSRLDGLSESMGMVLDLKTKADVSPSSMRRWIYSDGWFIQGAFYRRAARAVGVSADLVVIAGIDRTQPGEVSLIELGQQTLAAGDHVIDKWLPRIKEHWTGDWRPEYLPTASSEIETVEMEDWSLRRVYE